MRPRRFRAGLLATSALLQLVAGLAHAQASASDDSDEACRATLQ